MLDISGIGIATAFSAGAISFLSPCVLPLVPGYISYILGSSEQANILVTRKLLPVLLKSTSFVLGFSTIFIALGASASALSRLLLAYRYEANIVGGGIIIVFGLLTTQLVRPTWLQREFRVHSRMTGGNISTAYLLGLAFGFGWTPCIGPVLGAILTVSAVSGTAADGIALLTIYSIGLGVPFIVAAMFVERLAKYLKVMRRTGRILQLVAGGAMIGMGVAMITGHVSTFSFWLLQRFPFLLNLG